MAFNTGGLSDTYFELLENLKGYDNLMSSVKTKAGEISDKIMNWLGFTKTVNEETGEVTYNFERMNVGAWAVVGALGSLVAIPILGTIINIGKLLGFQSGFTALASIGAKLSPILTKVTTALVGLNPVTVAITAVVALFAGALIQLLVTSEDFRNKVIKAFEDVISIGRTFFETIKPYIDTIARSFISLWDFGIKPLWEGWVRFVEGVMNVMFALFDVAKPILDILAEAFGHIFGVVSTLIPIFNVVATIILGTLGFALGKLGDLLIWVAETIVWFRDNWNNIWSSIGNGFANFFKPVTDFFNGFVTWFANKINDLIRVYNAIPVLGDIGLINTTPTPTTTPKPPANGSGGSTKVPTVSMYASGGMPTQGEMFIARESGAELVGSIGSRTAVMNNEQIVQAVSIGVANAVSSVIGNDNGQNVILQVNDVTLGRVAINAINKTMKNTNLVLEV